MARRMVRYTETNENFMVEIMKKVERGVWVWVSKTCFNFFECC
jgi:hypothetical protein